MLAVPFEGDVGVGDFIPGAAEEGFVGAVLFDVEGDGAVPAGISALLAVETSFPPLLLLWVVSPLGAEVKVVELSVTELDPVGVILLSVVAAVVSAACAKAGPTGMTAVATTRKRTASSTTISLARLFLAFPPLFLARRKDILGSHLLEPPRPLFPQWKNLIIQS